MKGIEQIIAKRSKAEGIAEGIAQGKAEGIAQGKAEEKVEIAKKMLKCDEPLEKIVAITGLSLEQIKKIQRTPRTSAVKARKTTP